MIDIEFKVLLIDCDINLYLINFCYLVMMDFVCIWMIEWVGLLKYIMKCCWFLIVNVIVIIYICDIKFF